VDDCEFCDSIVLPRVMNIEGELRRFSDLRGPGRNCQIQMIFRRVGHVCRQLHPASGTVAGVQGSDVLVHRADPNQLCRGIGIRGSRILRCEDSRQQKHAEDTKSAHVFLYSRIRKSVKLARHCLYFLEMLRSVLAIGFLLGGYLTLVAHDVITTSVTWNREISRVFFDRCASCHNEKGPAFSMMTYAEARPWAVAIKEEILNRRMPPWGAVKGFGEFRNDQGLTQEQIELITSWVEGGVPEGNPNNLPAKPKLTRPAPVTAKRNQIVVTGELKLTKAFRLDGLVPEVVPPGTSLKIVAKLPDGSIEPLLWLYQYKKEHKHAFLLRKPLSLPAGTIIRGVPQGASVILLPA
jgi:hypothetical protein